MRNSHGDLVHTVRAKLGKSILIFLSGFILISVTTKHLPYRVDLFGDYDDMVRYIDEIDEKRSYQSVNFPPALFSKRKLSQLIKNKIVITTKIEILPPVTK